MKHQALFSSKTKSKKKTIKVSSATNLLGALRVNIVWILLNDILHMSFLAGIHVFKNYKSVVCYKFTWRFKG